MAELPPPPDRQAGYYPDPEGGKNFRWWDGSQWATDMGPTMDPDAPEHPEPAGPAEEKPGGSGGSTPPGTPKKRGQWAGTPWWAWVLAAIIGIVIISAIAGGGSTKTVTQTETHRHTQEVTVTAPQRTVTETTTVRVGG